MEIWPWDDDSDESDEIEFYRWISSDEYKRSIEKERQREKWLAFEYKPDYSDELDPIDGDLRGEYKENDKRRKKTWHSHGANPSRIWCKFDGWEKKDYHRHKRRDNKKYAREISTNINIAEKFHHGKSYKSPYG